MSLRPPSPRAAVRSLSLLALAVLGLGRGAEAQNGWVYLRAHPPGFIANTLGATHTYMQIGGVQTEVFTVEFAPGHHTFSQVVSRYGRCRASASNVGFDIVAGQWDTVDVAESWGSCFYQADIITQEGGEGSITTSISDSYSLPIDCQLTRLGESWNFANYAHCFSSVGYGTPVLIHRHATPGSFIFGHGTIPDDTSTITVDTAQGLAVELRQVFNSTSANDTAYSYQTADLSVTRTSGTRQGMVTAATFVVVNNGPDHALDIVPLLTAGSNLHTFGGSASLSVDPSRGDCLTTSCSLADLPPGDSVFYSIRVTANPINGLPTATPYCDFFFVAANGSTDPNPIDNSAPCTGDSVQVTVAVGGNPPPSVTVAKGTAAVPMLQFVLTPATAFTLDRITLSAAGSGNEIVDVTAVHLYVDSNGNGTVDPGEPLLASGTYGGNNGTATLNVIPPYGISAPTTFLVTYDFNLSLASRAGILLFAGVIPAGLLARRKRRGWAIGLLLAFMVGGLAHCGGGDSNGPGGGGDPTFSATLTGVTVSGVAVSGISIPGATVTVQR